MLGAAAGPAASRDPVPVRVSVVVAVHDPGPQFDDLVASLLAQSLPPQEFEVLFCDDGSGEPTRARLAAVTAGRPNWRVLSLEHSGWPGRPRNAGIDAARGRYLFFADHDDALGAEALERLCDRADALGSDVVVGHLVGVGRTLPLGTFARDVDRAVLGVDPLLDLLTPHKLFRTAFVREHGIRFPEGRVRLEDHLFVMRAYFAARVISILAGYPCYYWAVRHDRPSASAGLIDPGPYYASMEQVLDVVEAGAGPGELLDRLLPHWYGTKVLRRLGGAALRRYPDGYAAQLLAVARPLVARRFPARVDVHLPFPLRVRSALLRAGRDADLHALAAVEAGITGWATATTVRWTADGRLRVAVRAGLSGPDGAALAFVPAAPGGPATVWRPPVPLAADVATAAVLDAADDLARDDVQLFLRDEQDSAFYGQGAPAPGATGTVLVDPRTARSGRPVTARSALLVQVRHAGWSAVVPVRVDADVLAAAGADPMVEGRVLRVGRGADGYLRLEAEQTP